MLLLLRPNATLVPRVDSLSFLQDTLGNRRACERAVADALRAGRRVVIDRCNHDRSQREGWTNLLGRSGVPGTAAQVVWLDVPLRECKRRVMARTGHPTLPPTQKSMGVLDRFARIFEPPSQRTERSLPAILRVEEWDAVALARRIDDGGA